MTEQEANAMLEKQATLTEWDFDIPPDNRFNDPFQCQEKNDGKVSTEVSRHALCPFCGH